MLELSDETLLDNIISILIWLIYTKFYSNSLDMFSNFSNLIIFIIIFIVKIFSRFLYRKLVKIYHINHFKLILDKKPYLIKN